MRRYTLETREESNGLYHLNIYIEGLTAKEVSDIRSFIVDKYNG